MKLSPELSVRWYFPSRSMIIVCACCTMRMALDTYTRTTNPPTRMTSGKSEKGMAHVSLSTYRVVPSTRTTITRVPGSRGASISDAARQSSPSTRTRPLPVAGSMRADTIPTGGGQVEQQQGTHAHERQQRAAGEGQGRRHHAREHQRDQARRERAHGHREQPEPGCDHLGDAEQQGGDEPDLPFVHGGEVSAPRAGAPRGG